MFSVVHFVWSLVSVVSLGIPRAWGTYLISPLPLRPHPPSKCPVQLLNAYDENCASQKVRSHVLIQTAVVIRFLKCAAKESLISS